MSAADLQFPIIPKLRLSFSSIFIYIVISFHVMAKNIIVSNRLPIQITKVENFINLSQLGRITGLKSVHEHEHSLCWLAWDWH